MFKTILTVFIPLITISFANTNQSTAIENSVGIENSDSVGININITVVTLWYSIFSLWWIISIIIWKIFHPRTNIFKLYNLDDADLRNKHFAILIPCHNEDIVIKSTILSLMDLDYPMENIKILVICDACSDKTEEIVSDLLPDYQNLHLLSRSVEDGGNGKGDALNAGYKYMIDNILQQDTKYIVTVFDADSCVDKDMFLRTEYIFQDEKIGACQSGVRIQDCDTNYLLRYQDMEFALYSFLTQTIRTLCFGSASLGGNGQFIKQDTLNELEKNGMWWNIGSLTEDLEIGVRISLNGWKVSVLNSFVYQQGVKRWGQLLRQRCRWSWGHLTVSFETIFKILISRKINILQKIDWFILLFFWSIIVTLPIIWIFSILSTFGILTTSNMFGTGYSLVLGIIQIPLFFYGMFGSYYVKEYRTIKSFGYLLGFMIYTFHGILVYYYGLSKIITCRKTRWEKTKRYQNKDEEIEITIVNNDIVELDNEIVELDIVSGSSN
jgi:1,2-diacylglycerol 3-beta-glucosyltransferase